MKSFLKKLGFVLSLPLIAMLKVWHNFISPFLPGACRFYPTCSEYAVIAIKEHGLLRGLFLAVKRVGRCNHYFEGGIDYVPARKSREQTKPLG
jgi:uncharacterized protein